MYNINQALTDLLGGSIIYGNHIRGMWFKIRRSDIMMLYRINWNNYAMSVL